MFIADDGKNELYNSFSWKWIIIYYTDPLKKSAKLCKQTSFKLILIIKYSLNIYLTLKTYAFLII